MIIIGIALPNFVVRIIPTFESISYIAPLILLICRIIQGIFVGGEADSFTICIQENIKPYQVCLANSLNRTTSSPGIFIGSLVAWLCNIDGMPKWGWRILFAIKEV